MKIWNITNTTEEAFDLPEGSLCADFGFFVEISVTPDMLLEAVNTLKECSCKKDFASQASICVQAQKLGAFSDYALLKVF